MGGLYSGRKPAWLDGSPCKETTEDYFALDIRVARRHGLISPDQEEIPGVARIEWVPAGFGGATGGYERPYFLCPRPDCQKRVLILYGKKPGAPPWACRTCRDLCYPVERENRSERAIRRMGKARANLGPEPHIKPKRMRHKIYIRVASEYLAAYREAVEAQHEWNLRFLEQMQQEEEHFGSQDRVGRRDGRGGISKLTKPTSTSSIMLRYTSSKRRE